MFLKNLPQLSKCVVFRFNYFSQKDSTMFLPNSSSVTRTINMPSTAACHLTKKNISYLEHLPNLWHCLDHQHALKSQLQPGVSTSFEVGGWKTKVGDCDEARSRRPRDTRGVRGQAPSGNFWNLECLWCIFQHFGQEITTLRALLSKPFLPLHYKDILKNMQNVWHILLQICWIIFLNVWHLFYE